MGLLGESGSSNVLFYPLYLNNELKKYSCFQCDTYKEQHMNEEAFRLNNKLGAFQHKGTLDSLLCCKSFFSQEFFKGDEASPLSQ